ncbi:MAG: GatB/YqeY domain-containing protein [Calditrichia bacterium]|nr:GatB/YqeY domain-containing protein [Calditrichia bacterium]
MSVEKQLMEDMKLAMKSGNKIERDTIRMLRAQIKLASIDKKDELNEAELAQVLQKEAKKRKEAIELFQQGNREDLVKKEESELEIISTYLPEQLSDKDLDKIITEAIESLQVTSEKDMGPVMGAIMPEVKGKADGKVVQQKVKEHLAKLS